MAEPRKVGIVYAHPDPHASRVNALLLRHALEIPGVSVSDLYEKYPDFYVHAQRERQWLEALDLVVFQHPIYWYSCPALLKQWQEQVLTEGFAYGPGGDRLHGKDAMLVLSVGAGESDYRAQGRHGWPLVEHIVHLQQTLVYCGMRALEPMVFYKADNADHQALQTHARRYADFLRQYIQNRMTGSHD